MSIDWEQYSRDGFTIFDAATAGEIEALNARLEDIMLGRILYGDSLLMQLDPSYKPGSESESEIVAPTPSNEYETYKALGTEAQGQSPGFKGPSLAYRKIGEAQSGLEVDPVFSAFMRKSLFRDICDRVYGAHAGISVYRAMVMAKPPGCLGGGTALPWHQDGGLWWALDRDPLCFVWLALTDSTRENGAVQVVRGSHLRGILSRRGHTLSPEHVDSIIGSGDVVDVELKAGQAFLAHNWLVHRSGTNTTAAPRRGFSVNYIDSRTRVLDPKPEGAGPLGTAGSSFPLVFPSPFDLE